MGAPEAKVSETMQQADGQLAAEVNGLNSLGLPKSPADTRVVVAMSGGVDSSAVAAMLKHEGYDVIGVTLQLYDQGAALARKGACCAGQDIQDARRVAEALEFPHYVLDYEDRFRQSVMEEFADSYVAGETPIPCVRCNETVKFEDLSRAARDLGADVMATGHYVRTVRGPEGWELHRGADHQRDQSYFLFSTKQTQLDFLRFPLGGLNKVETRALAARLGVSVAQKADSQDICFVPSGGYAQVVERLRPGAAEPGEIVHMDGQVMGRHQGIIHYTIGQRRGLGIAAGEPLYVVKIDPEARRVIVGPREALLTRSLNVATVNWLGSGDFEALAGHPILAKVRSTAEPVPAVLFAHPGTCAEVVFEQPESGVSPGQACVFYDAGGVERLLGGGWIRRSQSVLAS